MTKTGKKQIGTLIYPEEGVPDYGTKEAVFYYTAMAGRIEQFGMNEAYRVGAVYYGQDREGRDFFIPCVNTIPDKILRAFRGQERLADSHMSVHAEMAGIIALPDFRRVSVALSRPICPTCLEGLSEFSNTPLQSGRVEAVYMDAHSLKIPATQEKWTLSEKMVRKIATRGHIGLGMIDAENHSDFQMLVAVSKENVQAEIENSVDIQRLESLDFRSMMRIAQERAVQSTIPGNREAAILIGKNKDGAQISVIATASLPPGFSAKNDETVFGHDNKTAKRSYLYQMDALKRALINAHAAGLDLKGAAAVCTALPSPGMLVNAVGYGVETIVTAQKLTLEPNKSRDHLFLHFVNAGVLKAAHV